MTSAPAASPFGGVSAPGVMMVFKGRGANAHPGVVDGLRGMVGDGLLRHASSVTINPADSPERQAVELHRMVRSVQLSSTELVVLYHLHSPLLPDLRPYIERIKKMPHGPLVALVNGDAFFNGIFRPSFPRMFLEAAKTADVVFTTSMGVSGDYIRRRTGSRVALLPLAACQVRFGRRPDPPPRQREFLVVFVGSNNRSRNPAHSYHWYGRRREKLVRSLGAVFGDRFALFGSDWEGFRGWLGPVPFAEQVAACRRAELVIGGVPFSPARYYMSNRPFIQITSGVPFLDLAVEGVEKILRPGEHWHLARSVDDVVDQCDDLLAQPVAQRLEQGMRAAEYVQTVHTQRARLDSLIWTLTRTRCALVKGSEPPHPDLRFFLPEVEWAAELPSATRGWAGGGGSADEGQDRGE